MSLRGTLTLFYRLQNCFRDKAIPYYIVYTKGKAVGLPPCSADRLHSMTHPTLPPAHCRQARKLYFVEIT